MEESYAKFTAQALQRVSDNFRGLWLHNRVALIVPDKEFRDRFEWPLRDALGNTFNERFELMDAEQASACAPKAEADAEALVLDTVQQFDGLERLIVIAIGLDTKIDDSEGTLETRSRLYRALTRAHMMTLVVNDDGLPTTSAHAPAGLRRCGGCERRQRCAASRAALDGSARRPPLCGLCGGR